MPSTSGKVPAAVQQVEERKAYWLKKRADAKEKGYVADEETASRSKPTQANGVAKGEGPTPPLILLLKNGQVCCQRATPEEPVGIMLAELR